MAKENSQEHRLKNIDETRNYFLEEIKKKKMSKKLKKACTTVNYIEHFLILASNTGWILISDFTYLISVSIEITSSSIELRICARNKN